MSQEKEFSSLQFTLRTGIASFCLQCPFLCQSKRLICPKQAFPLPGGDWAEATPNSGYFVVTLFLPAPARCTWHHSAPLPSVHLDLSPPYLCDSQMGLDCLIREERRHRVISGQTAPELLPGQRSVPHRCPGATELLPPSLGLQEGKTGKFCLQVSVIC